MGAPDLFDLSGKNALVTGGARGLGKVMARAIAEAGGRVAVSSRRRERAEEAAADLGHLAVGCECDVTEEESVDRLFVSATDELGAIDILVSNAGATWGAPSEEMPLEAWNKVLATNLTGTFLCSRRFGQEGLTVERGRKIIVVSSIAAMRGVEIFRTLGYSASKAGLLGLTRQLAVEWADRGITVNALALGFFPTRMSQAVIDQLGDQKILPSIPLRRYGNDDDVAGAVVFLASSASDYLTGQVLVVDGGMSSTV